MGMNELNDYHKMKDLQEALDEAKRILIAASHALRSYEYGNVAIGLAKEMADAIDKFIVTGEFQTLEEKKIKP